MEFRGILKVLDARFVAIPGRLAFSLLDSSRRLCPDGTKGNIEMARIARIKAEGEAFYHVVSRIEGVSAEQRCM